MSNGNDKKKSSCFPIFSLFKKNTKVGGPSNCGIAPDKSLIEFVEFLNGDDEPLRKEGKQFVNLGRKEKWLNKDGVDHGDKDKLPANIDRLGRHPPIKVKFREKGAYEFWLKYKYTPGERGGYTKSEKGRNDNFKYQENWKKFKTDGKGVKIINQNGNEDDFAITVAGGDKYSLVAKDEHGNEVKSRGSLVGHRLIYCQELKMNNTNVTGLNKTERDTFEGEFAKHHITLVRLDSVDMEHIPNIGDDTHAFESKAWEAYSTCSARAKEPHVVAIAFVDKLDLKASNKRVVKKNVKVSNVNRAKESTDIPIVDSRKQPKTLWPHDDPQHKGDWFVSATYHYKKSGGLTGRLPLPKIVFKKYTIARADVRFAGRTKVWVLHDHLPQDTTGTITLTVNWVDRSIAGISFSGTNLICIGKTSQEETVIHEMGHKIGMVVEGTDKQPDKVKTFYEGRGHGRRHCYYGASKVWWNLLKKKKYTPEDSKKADCVMYGLICKKTEFCKHCRRAVRKLDLSKNGWTIDKEFKVKTQ